jgi:hypothetical protein
MSNLLLKDVISSVSIMVNALEFITQLAVVIKRSTAFSLAVLNELKLQKLVPGKAGTFAFDVPCKNPLVFKEYHYHAKPQSTASRLCCIFARERQAIPQAVYVDLRCSCESAIRHFHLLSL